jgi:hypothetical protein
VLRGTALPIAADRFVAGSGARPAALRSTDWWAKAMQGQDFSCEDHLETAAFNAALWQGWDMDPNRARDRAPTCGRDAARDWRPNFRSMRGPERIGPTDSKEPGACAPGSSCRHDWWDQAL